MISCANSEDTYLAFVAGESKWGALLQLYILQTPRSPDKLIMYKENDSNMLS